MERDGVIGLHMVRPSARPGDMDTEVQDMLASGWSVPAGPDGEYTRGGAALETLITERKGPPSPTAGSWGPRGGPWWWLSIKAGRRVPC